MNDRPRHGEQRSHGSEGIEQFAGGAHFVGQTSDEIGLLLAGEDFPGVRFDFEVRGVVERLDGF